MLECVSCVGMQVDAGSAYKKLHYLRERERKRAGKKRLSSSNVADVAIGEKTADLAIALSTTYWRKICVNLLFYFNNIEVGVFFDLETRLRFLVAWTFNLSLM